MKILFCAAEADPFAKVGGLADVAAGLPKSLARLGHDVRVVIPCHESCLPAFETADRRLRLSVPRPTGGVSEVEVAIIERERDASVWIVRDSEFFPRPNIYGEPDDLLRYQAFCRATGELLTQPDRPDVLHLNDWHTASLAFAIQNLTLAHPGLQRTATILTIHNLRYRGPDAFTDFLGTGIYYADAITAVSPRYAEEILGWERGEGLQDLIGLRRNVLSGILNGLDPETWDPATDCNLGQQFSVDSLANRAANRIALRKELRLEAIERPLAAMVSRLTEQKGVDLVIGALDGMIARGFNVAVLGDGDGWMEEALVAAETRHPGRVRLVPGFHDGLGRRMYGGADMLLMPSRFEPCGLGQMIAMRYGCIPVARRTGGLADTVHDPWDHGESGTGFLFDEYSVDAFLRAVDAAHAAFKTPDWWRRMQVNGMNRDCSWEPSAGRYLEVYREALARRGVLTA